MSGEDEEGPPGLQIERTQLAWGRTALAFAAVGALMTHLRPSVSGPLAFVPGMLIVLGAAVVYVVGRLRHRDLETAVRAGRSVTAQPALRIVVGCAAAAALLGTAALVW